MICPSIVRVDPRKHTRSIQILDTDWNWWFRKKKGFKQPKTQEIRDNQHTWWFDQFDQPNMLIGQNWTISSSGITNDHQTDNYKKCWSVKDAFPNFPARCEYIAYFSIISKFLTFYLFWLLHKMILLGIRLPSRINAISPCSSAQVLGESTGTNDFGKLGLTWPCWFLKIMVWARNDRGVHHPKSFDTDWSRVLTVKSDVFCRPGGTLWMLSIEGNPQLRVLRFDTCGNSKYIA